MKKTLLSALLLLCALPAAAEETAGTAGGAVSGGLFRDLGSRTGAILASLGKAALIIVLGVLIIRLGRRLITAICKRYEKRHPEKHMVSDPDDPSHVIAPSGQRTVKTLVLSVFNYVMYFLIILVVLGALGVDISGLLTVAGVGGVAVGFGCQTLVKDFLSGMFLWLDGYVKVGDIVSVNGATGTVESVALRTTTLRCTNGNVQVIPNGDIRTVTNLTRDYRCALVDITVAHGQDYRRALEVLEEAMEAYDEKSDLIDEAPRVAGIISTDGRAATVRIETRCRVQDCWEIERSIRLCCLEAFRKENIRP